MDKFSKRIEMKIDAVLKALGVDPKDLVVPVAPREQVVLSPQDQLAIDNAPNVFVGVMAPASPQATLEVTTMQKAPPVARATTEKVKPPPPVRK
jgi:hypothetical protein